MKHSDVLFWKALSKLSREAGSMSCHPLQKYLDFRLLSTKRELPKFLPHTFSRFYRARNSPARKKEGSNFCKHQNYWVTNSLIPILQKLKKKQLKWNPGTFPKFLTGKIILSVDPQNNPFLLMTRMFKNRGWMNWSESWKVFMTCSLISKIVLNRRGKRSSRHSVRKFGMNPISNLHPMKLRGASFSSRVIFPAH